MKLSMKEKKILYAFACPSHELSGNEDGFVELTEEECRQLELPKEWIA